MTGRSADERRAPRGAGRAGAAGLRAWWAVAALAIAASAGVAEARPKRRDAKAAFDRGVAAYKKADFDAAAAAFNKSFELERDPDTLFAWAQAERKLEHCDKALALYDTLLGFELPEKNRDAVDRSIADCQSVIASRPPPAPAEPPPAPAPAPAPAPVAAPVVVVAPPAPAPAARPASRDPVALGLLGTGVLAGGIGAGLLVSAHSLDQQSHRATTIDDARRLGDQARSRGNIGLITAGAGGALLISGAVWILVHRGASEPRTVTGWLAPEGGGLAVTGAF